MLHRRQSRGLRYHRCADTVNADNCRSVCGIETRIGGIKVSDPAVGVEGVAGVVELIVGSQLGVFVGIGGR
jgi:hypothetical protein